MRGRDGLGDREGGREVQPSPQVCKALGGPVL